MFKFDTITEAVAAAAGDPHRNKAYRNLISTREVQGIADLLPGGLGNITGDDAAREIAYFMDPPADRRVLGAVAFCYSTRRR